VLHGLSQQPRTLPCKFFYDETGSALFLKICELPEYYITRTEMRILRECGREIGDALGRGIELIGLGTGAGTKTQILLQHLDAPVVYVPVDISREQLTQSSIVFRKRRSEEHTSELQSRFDLVCRLLLEKKKTN